VTWRGILYSLLSACAGKQIGEAWYLMASFMQHTCLHAHEYTVQVTCLKCIDCVSVLQEIPICLDVVSHDFLVVVFLDRRNTLAPTQLAGAGCPTHRSNTVMLREMLCLGSHMALPCFGIELLRGHLPSIHAPTLCGQGLHLYGPDLTYASIRVVGDGNESSMQDPRALRLQAISSCTLTLTPVRVSASCHLLSSSSLTFSPSPMPEGLEQVSTAEKFHMFNLFIHHSAVYLRCLCMTVKKKKLPVSQGMSHLPDFL